MRILGLLCVGIILLSSPGRADNLEGSLAIHLVASNDYLDCQVNHPGYSGVSVT